MKNIKEYFVIQSVLDFTFWSESRQEFKGWLFATKYNSDLVAYSELKNINKPCQILKIYETNN